MFLAFLDEKLPHDKSQKYDFKIMLSLDKLCKICGIIISQIDLTFSHVKP